jgi:phage gpG-like protein
MVATLTYRLDATEALSQLETYGSSASDLTILMDQIGQLLSRSATDRIRDTNVSPDGTPWYPSDRVDLFGGKTLLESGELARSITHEAGPDQVAIGSNMIYAGVHQTGAVIVPKTAQALTFMLPGGAFVEVGKVEIPARPYLGISDTDEEDILDLTGMYLTGETA